MAPKSRPLILFNKAASVYSTTYTPSKKKTHHTQQAQYNNDDTNMSCSSSSSSRERQAHQNLLVSTSTKLKQNAIISRLYCGFY